MPSVSFIVTSSLRFPAIKNYLSLWLAYYLMTGEALMTAEPYDAKQKTTNELMSTERGSELPATFYGLGFSGFKEPLMEGLHALFDVLETKPIGF